MRGLVVVIVLCSGCWVGEDVWYDLGAPDMSARIDLAAPDLVVADLTTAPDLYGYATPPDPFKAGTPRLSLGAFYEGGFSTEVPIDNATTHLYIYPSGNSAKIADDPGDKIEAYKSSTATIAGGLGWFGFGIHWDTARDVGAYKALHLALKSTTIADVFIGMNSPQANPQTAKVSAKSYGFTNDGQWHLLTIPIADLAKATPNPLDAARVVAPLVITNAGAVKDGDQIKIDDVYIE